MINKIALAALILLSLTPLGHAESSQKELAVKFLRNHEIGRTLEFRSKRSVDQDHEVERVVHVEHKKITETDSGYNVFATRTVTETKYKITNGAREPLESTVTMERDEHFTLNQMKSTGELIGYSTRGSSLPVDSVVYLRVIASENGLVMKDAPILYKDGINENGVLAAMSGNCIDHYEVRDDGLLKDYVKCQNFEVGPNSLAITSSISENEANYIEIQGKNQTKEAGVLKTDKGQK